MELTFYHHEFEREVRYRLSNFDGIITKEDAIKVEELDLTNFNFKNEDDRTLFCFDNLKILSINTEIKDALFWGHFHNLEDLYWECSGNIVDFSVFSTMYNLHSICVSGGDLSSVEFANLEAIKNLPKLQNLFLHEFGKADVTPLSQMTQLKHLALMYSSQIKNIDIIGTMDFLEKLSLDGLYVENLDFLDMLSDNVELEMCGIEIYNCKNIDARKWKRFKKRDICEIRVKDKWWDYLDLSVLEENI